MHLRLLLVAVLTAGFGCSGDAPVDSDVIRDAQSESATQLDDGVDEDTGESSDSADSAGDTRTEVASETSTDARPTCAMEESEPNNSLPSALNLKEIDDCDGSGSSFKGVVSGGTDSDFFHYKGNDKVGCVVDASASTKTAGVRLCVYVTCAAGTTELKSCKKGTRETSPGGVQGCCNIGPGEVVVEHGCPLVGTSDSADVYMRVDAPGGGSACTAYDVSYHF